MPASPDDLFAYLTSLDIPHQTAWHAAVFTVEEGRALRGDAAGGHTKNLFVRDKKGVPFLVVAQDDTAIELKSLHRLLPPHQEIPSESLSFDLATTCRRTHAIPLPLRGRVDAKRRGGVKPHNEAQQY